MSGRTLKSPREQFPVPCTSPWGTWVHACPNSTEPYR